MRFLRLYQPSPNPIGGRITYVRLVYIMYKIANFVINYRVFSFLCLFNFILFVLFTSLLLLSVIFLLDDYL